jgi:hypothetical protein
MEKGVERDVGDVVVLDEQDLEAVFEIVNFDVLFVEGRGQGDRENRQAQGQKPGSFPHAVTS